ncbi:MAG: YlmC/YmxH family sporulation protein [Acutalibacteraceae bacterium]
MTCRIADMRNKEVIGLKDGCRIGCVNDVEVDMKCAKLVAIIVYGRPKCFGIFGREDDIVIKWENIEVVGEDTILVNYNPVFHKKRKCSCFSQIFRLWK